MTRTPWSTLEHERKFAGFSGPFSGPNIGLAKFFARLSRLSHLACLLSALLCAPLAHSGSAPSSSAPAKPAAKPAAAAPVDRWAQLADPVFQYFSADRGLPNNIVTAVAQDGDGFIWAGTQSGIARWDGYRFRRYQSDDRDPGALSDNYVQTLFTDRKGQLWIGTIGSGLSRYDREHDNFINMPGAPIGSNRRTVNSITEDSAGGIWVGTEGGLYRLPPTPVAEPVLADEKGRPFPTSAIHRLLTARDGVLWVGTSDGLLRRDPASGAFTQIPLPPPLNKAAAIYSLYEAGDGRVFVGTRENGVYVVDSKTGAVQPLKVTGAGTMLTNEWVYAIAEPRPGQIWFSTYGNGIFILDDKGKSEGSGRVIRHEPTAIGTLADDTIWGMLIDRSGLLWVATTSGLVRHDPSQTAVLTLFGGLNRNNRISERHVQSIWPGTDERIWMGFASSGAGIIDHLRTGVTLLPAQADKPDTALPKARIQYGAVGPDGLVYMGTDSGLFVADAQGKAAHRIATPPRKTSTFITSLLWDASNLWIGGEGLWRFDLKSGRATQIGADGPEKLTDQRVLAIEPGPGKTFWIGTWNGLNLLDPVAHKVEHINPDPADPAALSSGVVGTLMTDHSGRLWIGTQGGINVMEKRDEQGRPRFHHIGTEHGLPNANISKIAEDGAGKIWASTDNGIVVIDPQNYAVRTLQQADGVAIPSYWNNAGMKTAAGEILFGGIGGMTVIRPAQLRDWRYSPPIAITDVHVNGKSLPPAAESLTITPDGNNFAIEFAALDYSAPDNNRFSYRLEGYDPDWIATDSNHRLATYTNLAPGDYRLRVRGTNRVGVWTEAERVLPIRVLPAWYQTWWFRLLLVTALAVGVYLLIRWRTQHLQQRQRELEAAAEALRASEQRYHRVVDNIGDALLVEDAAGKVVFANDRFLELFAMTRADLAAFKPEDYVAPEYREAVRARRQSRLSGEEVSDQFEFQGQRKDGTRMWLDARVSTLTQDGAISGVQSLIRDISAEKQAQKLIWQHANFDELTGLPNRRMFRDRLEQALRDAKRDVTSLAVLMVDLDHFKEINDTLGHDKGDLLLIQAGHRIGECLRESDLVARLGGDEFAIMLTDQNAIAKAEQIAHTILAALAKPISLFAQQAFVTASIGIVLYPEDADEIDELLKHVDQALYAAKGAGRNRTRFFTRNLQDAAQHRMLLTNDLRTALKSRQLSVHFQPIVHFPSGRIRKAEALIRWQHPTRGTINPADFIPAAEASGIITEIGNLVFAESARWVKRWRDRFDPDFQISINQSPREFQLESARYLQWIEHLRNIDLPGESIVVEITEGLFLEASADVSEKLQALRATGMRVAMDDFGTGYSSLLYLKKFAIDYLKIDQSFVGNIAHEADDMALSEAIIVMAHKLGLEVIAEGVETAPQHRLLKDVGCDYGQGFLFAKPMAGEELDALLQTELRKQQAAGE